MCQAITSDSGGSRHIVHVAAPSVVEHPLPKKLGARLSEERLVGLPHASLVGPWATQQRAINLSNTGRQEITTANSFHRDYLLPGSDNTPEY